MKRLIVCLFSLVLCLSLMGCGGVDIQPAVGSYQQVSENYNAFVETANAEIDMLSDEDIEFLNGIADVLNDYANKLSSGYEFTQEEVDEMIAAFEEFDGVLKEFRAFYEK